ncbi:MAG: hypothetical protein ACKPEQ_12715, partial [Dolichospermum sp.]
KKFSIKTTKMEQLQIFSQGVCNIFSHTGSSFKTWGCHRLSDYFISHPQVLKELPVCEKILHTP